MAAHKDSVINTIRGKNLVGKADKDDVLKLFEQLDAYEQLLDEGDQEDMYGTEGWRHHLGMED